MFFNFYFRPIKDEEQNQSDNIEENNKDNNIIEKIINEDCSGIEKVEDNNEDILLIIKIISNDYNNYFHYKNVEEIIKYCNNIFLGLDVNYNGKGKKKFFLMVHII